MSGRRSWGVVYAVAAPQHRPMAVACFTMQNEASGNMRKEFRQLAYTAVTRESIPELKKGLWERVCTDDVFKNAPVPIEIQDFVSAYDNALGAPCIAQALDYQKKYDAKNYTTEDETLRTRLLEKAPVYKNSGGHPYLLNYR